jgi:peptidoglycan/xylan/chitin deacetylase (PgdA/CDA1 family)
VSRLPILCYHNIGPATGARFPFLHVTETKLERQLWALGRLGLRGVSMTQGITQLRRGARSNLVVLTFDDGYRDTLTAALPLLLRQGFSATCYLVSDRIGGHNRWDEPDGRERHALMTRDEIGRWLEAGMEIASHTCSHPRLNARPAPDLAREIADSRASLRRTFGVAIDHFAYPYGELDARAVEVVKRCGYRSAVTTRHGVADGRDDIHRLPRVLVRGQDGLSRVLAQVAAHSGRLPMRAPPKSTRRRAPPC